MYPKEEMGYEEFYGGHRNVRQRIVEAHRSGEVHEPETTPHSLLAIVWAAAISLAVLITMFVID